MSCHRSTIADFSPAQRERLAVVALGSNLPSIFGDPVANIRLASEQLAGLSSRAPVISSLWQTEPVDCPEGSQPFINAVALLLPLDGMSAQELLKALQAMENAFGRQRSGILNSPRPLDLDLIAFGNERLEGDFLTLPHPRAHQRRFVLEPLAELAPDYRFPGQQATVVQLLAALAEEGGRRLP